MGWVRLDDAMPEHPKYIEAGPLAGWMAVCALAWSNRNLTNGFIPSRKVATLADFSGIGEADGTDQDHDRLSCVPVGPYDLASALVRLGIWESVLGGYAIHDYAEYQRSAQEIRELSNKRAEAGSKGARSRWGSNASQHTEGNSHGTLDDSADGSLYSKPMPNGMAKSCPNPNPIEPKSKPLPPVGGEHFESFWQAFPKRSGRKVGKRDAERIWRRLKPGEVDACLVAVGNYGKACDSGETLAQDCHRWLTKRRWEDWQESVETAGPHYVAPGGWVE